MDQDQILTVLAVDRAGSFTRAAQALNVTQSTVTARIRQLEAELGVAIWDRTTRRLVLTAEGVRLMELFRRSAILFERMREVVETHGFGHHLTFGSVHSQWSSGILPLLTAWAKNRPGITWRLITGHSRELLDGVRDGALDAAITYFPSGEHGLTYTLLAEQRLTLLAAPAMTSDALFRAEDVRNLPLAYLNWGEPFASWFQREFEGWAPAVQVDQAPLLIEILVSGSHVGFMPRVLANDAITQGRLVEMRYRPTAPMPHRAVYLVSGERALARAIVADLWNYLTEQGRGIIAGR
ncbi:MAG: LysR family transcriptional regulator [Thermaerobacter sp.]|nr:LysR family transcriptional regulator [Thermaerobacter sp.]